MFRTTIWKLPHEIRIAVAGASPGPLAVPTTIHHGRFHYQAGRPYATVHYHDSTSLLDRRGNVSHADNRIPSVSNEETISHGDRDPGQGLSATPDSLTSHSKEQLIAVIEHRIQESAVLDQAKLREHVQRASEGSQPLAALRELARTHPQSWEQAVTIFEQAKSTKVQSGGEVQELLSSKDPEVVQISEGTNADVVQLIDLGFLENNVALPTKDQYPKALFELFSPTTVAVAVHNACSKLKLSMQAEFDFADKADLSEKQLRSFGPEQRRVFVCTLKLDITDLCRESAIGEGLSKQAAKQAAWLHMVSKMHIAGTLRELFPTESSLPESVDVVDEGQSKPLLEPTHVDKRTMEDEKDAKIEIYNYAASFGLIPTFETKFLPRPSARITQQSIPIYQVTIQLEGQGINVTASGVDLRTAETAAAIAFKEQAQSRFNDLEAQHSSTRPSAFKVLNVDTATQFFEFYKDQAKGVNLEVEHESLEIAKTSHRATLTLNGKQIGQEAIMPTKKQAESIAYLTAAIEVASTNPQLLDEFVQTLNKGKGKVLRHMGSLDLDIEIETLQSMRRTLVEARNLGLSDSRQALGAETQQTEDEFVRRSWRLSRKAHESKSANLLAGYESFIKSPRLKDLRSAKAALPMHHSREHVIQLIDKNEYSIIIGATGSGKTTQVPQIIFEEAIKSGRGSSCNIICTQPRRIAATSVAHRVAAERDEVLRETVGYHVRADAKLPREPYGISYCTTGVLLEKVKHDPDGVLDTASHIIIDEVHERDLNIDFLMVVLKKAMQRRQADRQRVPKVVLMSATVDSQLFAEYFGKVDGEGKLQACPTLSVPGRNYPVPEKYLGSIMDELFVSHGASMKALLHEDAKSSLYLKLETDFSASQSNKDPESKHEATIDWKRERQLSTTPEEDVAANNEKEEALVPISLLVATIAHICTRSTKGAVLAFLPGMEEILEAQRMLSEKQPFGVDFSDASKFQICLLHSTIPKAEQEAIFQPSPPGSRKIILSTNIAETSVTVPDVRYVVDTGKLREKRYDQLRRITKLSCVWESKSNYKQRAGRAGRVQDGFYYALFSKERRDSLRSVGLPELLRSDLQGTCLSVKAQNFKEPVASFLAQAIEPPSRSAIDAAIQNLISIEAFTAEEELTALGRVLSQIPVHPALSKMIILGVIFRCLDPMIILGAGSEERSLFVRPYNARHEANEARRSYVGDTQSDHIAYLNAFGELRAIRNESGMSAVFQRAHEKFLHVGAFRGIDQTAKQIEEILEQSGLFVPDESRTSEFGPANLNRNSQNNELIKALLLAGCNPNLAAKGWSGGRSFRTRSEQNLFVHPSSVNIDHRGKTKTHLFGSLFACSHLTRSTDGNKLFLQDTTYVTPLMAILFGGHLRMVGDGRLEVDEWLSFFVKSADRQFSTRLILEFRKALDRVLNSAFRSLSDFEAGRTAALTSDPMREKFARGLVEVLHCASGHHSRHSWPQLGADLG